MKERKKPKPALVRKDPWLEPAEKEIADRIERYRKRLQDIDTWHGGLNRFSSAYQHFGIHHDRRRKGWYYREWAPAAQDLYLFGDFNDWQRYSHRLTRDMKGNWEIFLPDEIYHDRFVHQGRIKVMVHSDHGWHERIPAYIQRVIQDPVTKDFTGQIWAPPKPFDWEGDRFSPDPGVPPVIYECHVGMAMEREGVGTFAEFVQYLIPYIKNAGYNTIQLMAVAEHPYYGSFGYHVSNFFAVSSRFGTPEELKYLIRTAHQQGIAVIMDIVHSHTVKNTHEGLNLLDGSDDQYFHPGPRGDHPHWDSKCFNYGKTEVLQFLLSNVKYWLKEFRFDGYRFDGVTSMIYFDHGFRSNWDLDGYFMTGVEWDALTYLQLANTVAHRTKPGAITIAEEVSGMPGLCRPVREGGVGFDYRLAMAIPDHWIKLLKDQKDEDWNMHELWHQLTNRLPDVGTVAYCESHDQALVGDQTIAFRLMQSEMYFKMSRQEESLVIDRGMALHKMIRLITITLGGQAWLNFMGNEFGHPDWIDFPREGNNWSYQYARRQWSLMERQDLKYRFLGAFDKAMLRIVADYNLLKINYGDLIRIDEENKTIIFSKGGLILLFNFHPHRSHPGYGFPVAEPGDYMILLTTDHPSFGGTGRIDDNTVHTTLYREEDQTHHLQVYNTSRTGTIFRKR